MRFSAPSPVAATDWSGFMPAVGGCLAVDPVVDVEPQAVTATIAAAAVAAMRSARSKRVPFISPLLLGWHCPGRTRDPGSRRGLLACPHSPGPAPGRPYSAVP